MPQEPSAKTLILVVDDEPELLDVVRDFLSDLGFDSVLARCALDGLSFLQALEPDAVVTDVQMPGLSGLEFLAIVRRTCAVPVIVVTADTRVTAETVAALGGTALIAKPFFLDALGECLTQAVGRPRSASG